MNGAARRFLPLLVVGALLAAVAVAVSLSSPQVTRVPSRLHLSQPSTAPSGPPRFHMVDAPPASAQMQRPIQLGWLGVVLEVLCGILVVAVVGVLIFLLLRGSLTARRRRLSVEPGQPRSLNRREEVLAAVDAGLADLDGDERDPRRAVIACWVRLEQAAAAAGTPRQPGDAPADLVVRLLAAHQVSAAVLYPLADVYRLARYATHTVDPTMRDQARAALSQLRAELTVSRSGPLADVP